MSSSLFLRINSIFLAGNFENYLVYVVLPPPHTGTKSTVLHTFRNHIWKITETWRSNSAELSLLTHSYILAPLYTSRDREKKYIMASLDNGQWFYLLKVMHDSRSFLVGSKGPKCYCNIKLENILPYIQLIVDKRQMVQCCCLITRE